MQPNKSGELGGKAEAARGEREQGGSLEGGVGQEKDKGGSP